MEELGTVRPGCTNDPPMATENENFFQKLTVQPVSLTLRTLILESDLTLTLTLQLDTALHGIRDTLTSLVTLGTGAAAG